MYIVWTKLISSVILSYYFFQIISSVFFSDNIVREPRQFNELLNMSEYVTFLTIILWKYIVCSLWNRLLDSLTLLRNWWNLSLFLEKNEKNEQNIFFLFLDEFFVKAIKLSLLPTYFGFQVNKHVSIAKKGKIHFSATRGHSNMIFYHF